MKKILVLVFMLLAATMEAAWCQAPATGAYPFSSFDTPGFDSVNLGTLNARFNIPIVNRQGRGVPFNYSIDYEGQVWSPVTSNGSTYWVPDPVWGFQGLLNGAPIGGVVTYNTTTITCSRQLPPGNPWPSTYSESALSGFVYRDSFGSSHSFNYATNNIPGPQCQGSVGNPTAFDGSGYTVSVPDTISSQGTDQYGAPQITGSNGSVFTPGGTSSNNIIMTDANGNQITENASGVYTDTLGVQAMTVTGSLSAAHAIPITLAYPVTLQSNSATTKTATVVLGSFTVRTNFGCSGISEYGSTTTNLINRIILGDGSSYAFTYEGTPGAKDAAVTGRLASITLPSGGVISYTYSGGCTGGINTNGTVPTLKRVTTDGTRLYTSSVIGVNGLETTTTLQDEKQNQSVFNFALANDPSGAPGTKYFYETHRTIYQQAVAPGNVLFDQTTCYNGASPCDGEQVALPITQTSTTGSYNGVNASIVTNVYDKTFGMLMSTTQMVGTTTIESTAMTYAGSNELLSVVTQDGYGDQISSVTYKYDENQAASTANMSIPQHTTPPGAPGNQTSSHTWTGSGSSTLDTATSYWDTGMPVSTTTPNGTLSYHYDTATQAFAISTGAPVAGCSDVRAIRSELYGIDKQHWLQRRPDDTGDRI